VVSACEFSPKGDTIMSGSWDKTLKIWDVASGTCKATLEGHRYLSLFTPLRGEEA
jgi:WD40 repeat protein